MLFGKWEYLLQINFKDENTKVHQEQKALLGRNYKNIGV